MTKAWSNEELEILKELFPNGDKDELIKIFNRKFKTIDAMARKQGLVRTYRTTHNVWKNDKNIEYLINNFANESIDILAKKIGTTINNVRFKAYSLGLKRNHFWWTKEKEQVLLDNYYSKSADELCAMLNYNNWSAIRARANILGLKKFHWDDDKDKFLKEHYYSANWDFLLSGLGVNKKITISGRARKLKLERRKKFTKEENEFIKNNYLIKTSKEIAVILNRTPNSIDCQVIRLDLKRAKEWIYLGKKVLLTLLVDLSKKLGRTPTSRELTNYNLPSPITYSRYFGTYAEACKLAGLKTRTTFGLYCLSKNNDFCYSSAEAIITNFFIDKGIEYIKNQPYSNYIESVVTNKTVDWILKDGTFVEYFGLPKKKYYAEKMIIKIKTCENNNIHLISLLPEDIKNLETIFKEYLS